MLQKGTGPIEVGCLETVKDTLSPRETSSGPDKTGR